MTWIQGIRGRGGGVHLALGMGAVISIFKIYLITMKASLKLINE